MSNKKLMILTICIVSLLLAISAVGATDNGTDDAINVDESVDVVDVGETTDDVSVEDVNEDQSDNLIGIEDQNDVENEVIGVEENDAVNLDESVVDDLDAKDLDSEDVSDEDSNIISVSENGDLMAKSDESLEIKEMSDAKTKNPPIQAIEDKDFISKSVNQDNSKLSRLYSDAHVYLKYIKTYYNSGKYFYLGWSGYFDGYFKVYRGNSLYHKESLYGYSSDRYWSLSGMPAGKYTAKLVDYSGYTLGKTKIIIKKASSKIYVKSFSASAKSTFYCYAYVYGKYSGEDYNGGTVKFYIGGKVYKAKLRNGVAVAKIKIPSKAKRFKCGAVFLGNKYAKKSSTIFKIKVKPEYKIITTTAKFHEINKKSGQFSVKTHIYDFTAGIRAPYKCIDILLFKNGKQIWGEKYFVKYKLNGKWTGWTRYGITETCHQRHYVKDGVRVGPIKIKVKNNINSFV